MARKTAPRARPQPRQIFGITPAGTPDIRSLLETFMGIGDASPDGVFAYFRIVAWLYHMGDGGTPDCQTTVIAVYGAPELAGADGPLGAYLTFGPCPPNPTGGGFPPGYDATNRMLYLYYRLDQFQQVREILGWVGGATAVYLYYNEFGATKWAELFHVPLQQSARRNSPVRRRARAR
jgi:hypothetical protein